jgi:hypothetical protein
VRNTHSINDSSVAAGSQAYSAGDALNDFSIDGRSVDCTAVIAVHLTQSIIGVGSFNFCKSPLKEKKRYHNPEPSSAEHKSDM